VLSHCGAAPPPGYQMLPVVANSYDVTHTITRNNCLPGLAGNMHLHTADGKIARYERPTDIIADFFPLRLKGYAQRKASLLEQSASELLMLDNKVRPVATETTDTRQSRQPPHRLSRNMDAVCRAMPCYAVLYRAMPYCSTTAMAMAMTLVVRLRRHASSSPLLMRSSQ
jgi:hypothetical protein